MIVETTGVMLPDFFLRARFARRSKLLGETAIILTNKMLIFTSQPAQR
jgi:hypothetical protein